MEVPFYIYLFTYHPFCNDDSMSDCIKLSGKFIDIWKGMWKANPDNIHVFPKQS